MYFNVQHVEPVPHSLSCLMGKTCLFYLQLVIYSHENYIYNHLWKSIFHPLNVCCLSNYCFDYVWRSVNLGFILLSIVWFLFLNSRKVEVFSFWAVFDISHWFLCENMSCQFDSYTFCWNQETSQVVLVFFSLGLANILSFLIFSL